jgi:phage regulator Rha-like protein
MHKRQIKNFSFNDRFIARFDEPKNALVSQGVTRENSVSVNEKKWNIRNSKSPDDSQSMCEVSAERTTITQIKHPSIKAKFMQKYDKVRDKSAIIRIDSGNQFNTHNCNR